MLGGSSVDTKVYLDGGTGASLWWTASLACNYITTSSRKSALDACLHFIFVLAKQLERHEWLR